MSHGNEMICQQVTLSGYAEWPKVADAVIEAFHCSHASHPWSGELFSSSRIKAYQGKYHSLWVPCTRLHKE